METGLPAAPSHCGYCGLHIDDEVAAPSRFGERFCSERHADEFATRVPALLLLAMPLVWSGGWAAAGGSLLSVLALLACPLGMYFMMRSKTSMQHRHGAREAERDKEDRRA